MNPVIIHHDFRELREKASNAAKHILMCSNLGCTNNYMIPTTSWSINEDKKWMINLKCSVCPFRWSVCCKCENVKVRLVTSMQIRNHHNSSHKEAGIARKMKRKTVSNNESSTKKKNKMDATDKETKILTQNITATMIENKTKTVTKNMKQDINK
jgi:hypothetical protein